MNSEVYDGDGDDTEDNNGGGGNCDKGRYAEDYLLMTVIIGGETWGRGGSGGRGGIRVEDYGFGKDAGTGAVDGSTAEIRIVREGGRGDSVEEVPDGNIAGEIVMGDVEREKVRKVTQLLWKASCETIERKVNCLEIGEVD